MGQHDAGERFSPVGDGSGLASRDEYFKQEVQLALRNRGMPLEGLRYPITPSGMHYLLVHFDIPEVDVSQWRLEISGLAARPLSLSLDDIKKRPSHTAPITMECAGNGRAHLSPRPISQPWLGEAVGTAEWTGTPLRGVLREAGVSESAREIVFTGLDRGVQDDEVHSYERSLSVDDAMREEVMLAYRMNGVDLPPEHGYPLRLIVPGWYGMASVKWLTRIEAVGEPFQGYQVKSAYRYSQSADEPGDPVTMIRVRALMTPPGIPDFLTRTRLVEAGPVTLKGRAWAGRLDVARVEVSMDGGSSWSEAALEARASTFAWRAWSFPWDARPGRHILRVRATDAEGNVQPVDQPWNFQGMGNNMAQRVDVVVE